MVVSATRALAVDLGGVVHFRTSHSLPEIDGEMRRAAP